MNRRTFLGSGVCGAVVGLAGCQESGGTDGNASNEETGATASNGDANGAPSDLAPVGAVEADVSVDWESVAPFRTWMTSERHVEGGLLRFAYADEYARHYVSPGPAELFDLTAETVSGHLVQGSAEIHFGEFDADTQLSAVESSEDHEVTETYEGYSIVDDAYAVGEDAILWQHVEQDLTHRIDVHRGEAERLEEAYPEYTLLFEELPEGAVLEGQYSAPTTPAEGVNTRFLYGLASDSLEPGSQTWAFVFQSAEDLTDAVVSELESIPATVEETSRDGRTLTITGTVSDSSG